MLQHYIIAHEHTQLKQIFYFCFSVGFPASRSSFNSYRMRLNGLIFGFGESVSCYASMKTVLHSKMPIQAPVL